MRKWQWCFQLHFHWLLYGNICAANSAQASNFPPEASQKRSDEVVNVFSLKKRMQSQQIASIRNQQKHLKYIFSNWFYKTRVKFAFFGDFSPLHFQKTVFFSCKKTVCDQISHNFVLKLFEQLFQQKYITNTKNSHKRPKNIRNNTWNWIVFTIERKICVKGLKIPTINNDVFNFKCIIITV